MSSIIGVDLGGTKIAATRYDASSWKAQASARLGTQADKPFSDIVAHLLTLIERIRTPDTIAIGIGVPGLIRHPSGGILTLPNISEAESFPLREHIARTTQLPTEVENDSSCFTLAETLHGAGKGHDVVVGVTMGTGVGGGIVIGESIFHGSHGFAAEFGHMLLKPGEPPEASGHNMRGEVEQFLSGTAMGERCTAAKRPEDYLEGEVCAFLRPEVIREVAWMCANLTHCIDPAVIVFGGSTGRALRPHLKDIEKELKQWVLPMTPLPKLAIGMLQDAGTMGAALLTKAF